MKLVQEVIMLPGMASILTNLQLSHQPDPVIVLVSHAILTVAGVGCQQVDVFNVKIIFI